MTRSKWSLMLQAGIAGLLLVACAPDTVEDSETTSSESVSVSSSAAEMQTFTLEELSQYTGKDGQPGYVAVDGVVYDVTNVEAWFCPSLVFYLDEYCDKKVTNFQGFFLVCRGFLNHFIILRNGFMERFQSVLKALFYPLWLDDSILNRIRTFQNRVKVPSIFRINCLYLFL